MYHRSLSSIGVKQPTFIAGLPRAGTTLLLDLLVESGRFASHCYRDMPFLLCPLFWHSFAHRFRRTDRPRERAHGDGMLVNVDSPEAFEEVIWRAFFPEHYRDDHIAPWHEVSNDEFAEFLSVHLRKIILLRGDAHGAKPRYVSKNNLNIARVPILRSLFPDAVVVIPYRSPVQHAASLLRQHENFTRIHASDPFARDYMEGIGHYDFGANLRPVDFDEWWTRGKQWPSNTLNFWLSYWHAAYRTLLKQREPGVVFVSFDHLCADPENGLSQLARAIALDESILPENFGADIQAPREHRVELSDADEHLLSAVNNLYDGDLRAASINS